MKSRDNSESLPCICLIVAVDKFPLWPPVFPCTMYSYTYRVDLYNARGAATYKLAFLSCLHQIFLNRQFAFPELLILFKGIAPSLSLTFLKCLILGKRKHELRDLECFLSRPLLSF